ncbi:3,4-dehydroadipyl-CoA semialdehyde dehydrogenase [Cupriavidus sp. AU9028]|uniref:3,4-dehydroadipyl-CoA semialdehyde dehydrogenase n=1 Tax=Cupriavidus sp. AU9028 TaxID=2871157 RepID=UPI001C95D007|nr:3,4-dehydroadipyl-CoA semialdehyde dehydrogenase [Cupriavidus sp. AU9028]MBY4899093.1 3,4-dehydroadipyl-CoA semialdehyde dehydrogenase [Cupriavidus sp. AU9028]
MQPILPNHLAGRWQTGTGGGQLLRDPVLGEALVRVDAQGLDLEAGFAFAREHGGKALRALTYRERAALLSAVVDVLQQNRDAYYDIATANSGTVRRDSAVDIDGAIFTLKHYARIGATLGDARHLPDGEAASLSKDGQFQSLHVQVPSRGLALLINAFNFPGWGLWEKAGPALLSGVPVVVKPATATAWLTQRMVEDVVKAGVLPAGALSIVCGSPAGLLDALQPFDLLSFTGSADTAQRIRSHPAIAREGVRLNVEADSVNAALLLPDGADRADRADGRALELLADEVVREMTVKSGQKCTAIRRVLVPAHCYDAAAAAIAERLARVSVGNPRNASVTMGSLVSRTQLDAVHAGLAALQAQTQTLVDGTAAPLIDADPQVACCIGPTLLGARDAGSDIVHETEVFGPVATLIPYGGSGNREQDIGEACALIRRGKGSLVASLYGTEAATLAATALELADSQGRVHVITPDVAGTQTGHGNVMPQSLHGGPGRAGGGEELGGIRALNFYHRRCALQASTAVLGALATGA